MTWILTINDFFVALLGQTLAALLYALLTFCVALGIYKFVKDWLPF